MKHTIFAIMLFLCTLGTAPGVRGQSVPQSVLSGDTSGNWCGHLFSYGVIADGNQLCKQAYDTLRLFITSCPFYPRSWDAFSYLNAAVSGWQQGGTQRWPDYLQFLKQVLYLNPDTNWYCEDVGNMITAEQYDERTKLAELKYILDNHKCQGFDDWATLYDAASHWEHQFWLDSIAGKYDTVPYHGNDQYWVDSMVNIDTLAHPYDSTIASLYGVGLQILIGPQYANTVSPSGPITSQAMLNAQFLDNPTNGEIAVSFEMGRTALVSFELRDILGRAVPLTYRKYQLEQLGTHEARIPAPNLPPGTYYLRLVTDGGESRTLKIVKE